MPGWKDDSRKRVVCALPPGTFLQRCPCFRTQKRSWHQDQVISEHRWWCLNRVGNPVLIFWPELLLVLENKNMCDLQSVSSVPDWVWHGRQKGDLQGSVMARKLVSVYASSLHWRNETGVRVEVMDRRGEKTKRDLDLVGHHDRCCFGCTLKFWDMVPIRHALVWHHEDQLRS